MTNNPMTVRDLISNPNFNINCHYEVYDCTDHEGWSDTAPSFSTYLQTPEGPSEEALNLLVSYITIDVLRQCIVIEGKMPGES